MYNEFLKSRLQYIESKTNEIEYVNNNKVPQNVLWQKEVAEKLKDELANFITIEDKFYFTEQMVNKLMHFSFLMGSKNFEKESYQKGWDDCLEDIKERLEL